MFTGPRICILLGLILMVVGVLWQFVVSESERPRGGTITIRAGDAHGTSGGVVYPPGPAAKDSEPTINDERN
jgi:hypothetical protein